MNRKVEQIFNEAMDRDPGLRARYLDEACEGDAELRLQVEALIADSSEADALFSGAIGRLAVSFRPQPGAQVGAYKLIRPIGEGGMGVVYLAERADGQFQQQVAVKFVQGGSMSTARFYQERQILARLEHPGIARLIDGGISDDGVPFMVMDYFDGVPITEYLARKNVSREERLRLFQDVCSAVEYAHRSLTIHRDLKPANILVNDEGMVKLVDFGIAKLVEQGPALTVTGGGQWFTPEYASPEQVRGEPITTAADVYSLGAVLFELLVGHSPHKLTLFTPVEITQVVCLDPAPALGLGNELDHIVAMALRKEPERRYASVAQLSEDVRRFLSNHPVLARPDSRLYRATKFIRRHRAAVTAAAVAIVSLVGGLGVAAWQARVARYEAAQSQRRFEQVRKLARTVLFDFDAKIRDLVGATEARELLAKTALEYMDSLYADAQHDLGLRRELAAAYERIADVQGEPARPNLGQRGNAIKSYRKAAELWEGIAGRDGFDPLALARVYLKSHDLTGHGESLQKGADTAERAHAAQPDNEEAFLLAVRAWNGTGTRHKNRSEWDKAIEHYRHALALTEEWQAKHGPQPDRLARCYSNIAYAAIGKGDAALALESIDHVIAIQTPVAEAKPNDVQIARQLFKAYMFRGDALGNPEIFHLGRVTEAVESYHKSLRIAERLLAADPRNALARADLADVTASLGQTLTPVDPRQAKPYLERGLQEALAVLRGSPETLSFIHNAANYHIFLARAQRALNELPEAIRNAHAGLDKQREIADSRPKQIGLRHNLIATLAFVAQLHLDVGDLPPARAAVDEALKISATVERNSSYQGKVSSIADAYAAAGRLHRVMKSPQAPEWYGKSLALWSELESAGVSPAFVKPNKDAVFAESRAR